MRPAPRPASTKLNIMSKSENPDVSGLGTSPPEMSKLAVARGYGDCYEASFNSAVELILLKSAAETNPVDESLRRLYDGLGLAEDIAIVHGSAQPPDGPDRGRTIYHAWVEVGESVIETSNGQREKYSTADYYEHFKIEVLRRYSVGEARALAEKHNIYGLWHTMR